MRRTTPEPSPTVPPSVALVTSIYGEYDQVCVPVRQDIDCSYQLVTDCEASHDMRRAWEPWTVHTLAQPGSDPRHAARWAKFRPDLVLDPVPDVVVWIDGRVVVTSPGFVSWMLGHLGDADVALWRHPTRTSTAAEAAAASVEMPGKYLAAQLAGHHSQYAGQPDTDLWRLTIFAARVNPLMMALGEQVMTDMTRYPRSIDQITWPHAARRLGAKIAVLPGDMWDYPGMLHLRPHADGT